MKWIKTKLAKWVSCNRESREKKIKTRRFWDLGFLPLSGLLFFSVSPHHRHHLFPLHFPTFSRLESLRMLIWQFAAPTQLTPIIALHVSLYGYKSNLGAATVDAD